MTQPLLHYTDTETDEEKVLAHDPQQDEKYHAQLLKDIIASPDVWELNDISDVAIDIIYNQIQLASNNESDLWDIRIWSDTEVCATYGNLYKLLEQLKNKSKTIFLFSLFEGSDYYHIKHHKVSQIYNLVSEVFYFNWNRIRNESY